MTILFLSGKSKFVHSNSESELVFYYMLRFVFKLEKYIERPTLSGLRSGNLGKYVEPAKRQRFLRVGFPGHRMGGSVAAPSFSGAGTLGGPRP